MIRLLTPALLLLLMSCQPFSGNDAPPDTGLAGFDPDAVEKERAACERRSGVFAKAGASGGLICVETTRDAGKSCTAGSQCDGLCLARTGTCAPIKPLFGCNDILTNNGARQTICID